MNITFTPQPIPELAIDGGTLAGLGFTPGPLAAHTATRWAVDHPSHRCGHQEHIV